MIDTVNGYPVDEDGNVYGVYNQSIEMTPDNRGARAVALAIDALHAQMIIVADLLRAAHGLA